MATATIKVPDGALLTDGKVHLAFGAYDVVQASGDDMHPYDKAQQAASLIATIRRAIQVVECKNVDEVDALLQGMETGAIQAMAESKAN